MTNSHSPSSAASEQDYLEDNIATLAHHLAQPGAFLCVHYDGAAKLLVDPGEVLKEASRRLSPEADPSAATEGEIDFNDPLTSRIMGAARLHTHDHTMAYNITRDVLAVLDEPQAAPVPADQVARTLALSYGRDPDALTEWTEMCDAHNRPVPIWKVYEEQAEALLASYSITRPHGGAAK